MATIEEALKMAADHQRARQSRSALEIYREILEKYPGHPDALLGLAQAAQSAKQFKGARTLIDFVLEYHPAHPQGWFSLGNWHQSQGQWPEAESAFRNALSDLPDSFNLLYELGKVLQEQGKLEEAADYYQKALSINKQFIEAELSLVGIRNLQEKLLPDEKKHYARILNNKGFSNKQAGNLSAAIDDYQLALELQPKLEASQFNLGVALQDSGKTKEAIHCFEQVNSISNNTAPLFGNLAASKLKQLHQTESNQPGNRKKLAFICQPTVQSTFPPFGRPTDSLAILTHELSSLLARNYETTIYLPGEHSFEVHHDGITYIYIPTQLDRTLEQSYRSLLTPSDDKPLACSEIYFEEYASSVARELQNRGCDLVHIWSYSQFISPIRNLNPAARIILHLEDEFMSRLNSKMIQWRLDQVDCVIACSHYITDKLKERFPEHMDLFKTVYNAANFDLFFDGSVDIEDSNEIQQESPAKILFAGAISPEKGSHILLEAFEKVSRIFPDAELTMAGPNYVLPYEFSIAGSSDPKTEELIPFHQGDNWNDYLQKYFPGSYLNAQGYQSGKIHFTGLLTQDALAAHYQQSDIFVFPSVWNEPFGMPVVEAMMAGKSVITTTGGAFPEIIDDGITGLLVERGSVDCLAEAIIKLLSDPELRQKLGKNAFLTAVEKFTFQKMAANIESVYQGSLPR